MSHTVLITPSNPVLSDLKLSWSTVEFTAEDGIGPLRSLHEAGDGLVALASVNGDGVTILGSGVMVGPGLLVTATHVLDEFPRDGGPPVFMTFLPDGARTWLPLDVATLSKPSEFDERWTVMSDMSLVSCTLNSEAHAKFPLMLAPMQIALPLIGERLWAIGFRHQALEDRAALVTPLISSGLVTAAYPNGRGERMPSPCFEVNMNTVGGMSGGAVVNDEGYLVGILSSSFEGGPSYVTLIWEALRLRVKGAVPKLQADNTVSLLGAKALGLVKLKGNVDRNPWGDLTLRLSDEENRLLASSVDEPARTPGLTDDEREEFLDTWGGHLESMGSEATIATLERLPLHRMKDFL
ncbi:MAG: trypsin-like serine peptidase, partial [Afipia sp.]